MNWLDEQIVELRKESDDEGYVQEQLMVRLIEKIWQTDESGDAIPILLGKALGKTDDQIRELLDKE